jgi:DNA modification methylase
VPEPYYDKDAGLRCVGIEAEERYCEMAVRRLAQGVFV